MATSDVGAKALIMVVSRPDAVEIAVEKVGPEVMSLISSQEIHGGYLDTNLMTQPHTDFISKLPRMSDRQAVAKAFGVSEELPNQTFEFKKASGC